MIVSELIELLKTCDPKARVVVNEEPIIEEAGDLMAGAMQVVDAIEVGWADEKIDRDMIFSLRPVGSYLVPAVRIMGGNHEPTNPDRKLSINGSAAMKDVKVEPVRRVAKPSA